MKISIKISTAIAALLSVTFATTAQAVIFHSGSGTIDGSLCVGFDCASSESFGFDTIRLKENNLRINFADTSTAASFPTSDWTLEANDSSNGGSNHFAILDINLGSTPFKVEAGAGNAALHIDNGGEIGLGTSSPVTNLHMLDGDTPTMRLEQDGSSGFSPQTWDVAGNETNFFIRNVTNGSRLPFKIMPDAEGDALVLGEKGLGVGERPSTTLDGRFIQFASGNGNDQDGFLQYTDNTYRFVMADGVGAPEMELTSEGVLSTVRLELTDERTTENGVQIILSEEESTHDGFVQVWQDEMRFVFNDGVGDPEMELNTNGDLTIAGTLTTAGATCGGGCDAVFTADYDLPSIEDHAELMWSNGYLPNVGPTIENTPINVSDKLGRMLNELEKAHIYIAQVNQENNRLNHKVEDLEERLASLESAK